MSSLVGKYQLGDIIGQGIGGGKVFKALDMTSGEFFAVKQVNLDDISQSEIEEILRHSATMCELIHPGIVRYHDCILTDDCLNFIMEYVEGGSLAVCMQKFGPFPESLISLYIEQILKALDFLHSKNLTHGSPKASNILITKDGTVKLGDIAVSKHYVAPDPASDSGVDAPFWTPPEVLNYPHQPVAVSDIWTIGVTVLELLQGRPPYYGMGTMEVISAITNDPHPKIPKIASDKLRGFLKCCFVKDPKRRSTALDLLKNPWITKEDIRQPIRQLTLRDVGRTLKLYNQRLTMSRGGGVLVPNQKPTEAKRHNVAEIQWSKSPSRHHRSSPSSPLVVEQTHEAKAPKKTEAPQDKALFELSESDNDQDSDKDDGPRKINHVDATKNDETMITEPTTLENAPPDTEVNQAFSPPSMSFNMLNSRFPSTGSNSYAPTFYATYVDSAFESSVNNAIATNAYDDHHYDEAAELAASIFNELEESPEKDVEQLNSPASFGSPLEKNVIDGDWWAREEKAFENRQKEDLSDAQDENATQQEPVNQEKFDSSDEKERPVQLNEEDIPTENDEKPGLTVEAEPQTPDETEREETKEECKDVVKTETDAVDSSPSKERRPSPSKERKAELEQMIDSNDEKRRNSKRAGGQWKDDASVKVSEADVSSALDELLVGPKETAIRTASVQHPRLKPSTEKRAVSISPLVKTSSDPLIGDEEVEEGTPGRTKSAMIRSEVLAESDLVDVLPSLSGTFKTFSRHSSQERKPAQRNRGYTAHPDVLPGPPVLRVRSKTEVGKREEQKESWSGTVLGLACAAALVGVGLGSYAHYSIPKRKDVDDPTGDGKEEEDDDERTHLTVLENQWGLDSGMLDEPDFEEPSDGGFALGIVGTETCEDSHGTYTAYHIRIKDSGKVTNVFRRYSEFKVLDDFLRKTAPQIEFPALPPKKFLFGNLERKFVLQRGVALNKYLRVLMDNPELISLPVVVGFLDSDVTDISTIMQSE